MPLFLEFIVFSYIEQTLNRLIFDDSDDEGDA